MTRPTLLALSLTLVAVAPTAAQHDFPVARIDSVFLDMNRSDRPGCTLGIFAHGNLAYANGYGMANLEYGVPITPSSIFHRAE